MKTQPTNTNQRHTSRQASILICVLVCLAVATAMVTSTVRTALGARRAMRTQHQLRQTELLLAAGVQRAAGKLHTTDDYTGETWNLPPQTIPGWDAAHVEITVVPSEDDTPPEVRVTARLSVSKFVDIQRSHTFFVNP